MKKRWSYNFSSLPILEHPLYNIPTIPMIPKMFTKNIDNTTFFISHGSPTLSIDESLPARRFLQGWKQNMLGQIPKSILMISGHWETEEPAVTAIDGPCDVIYDFYRVPAPMFQLKYPAPGAPHLAKRVQELLMRSGFINRVHVDKKRGLDHGAWVPLMLMYPEANIPVCQLSIQSHLDGTYHCNLGRTLAPLKKEGVLIIGSGSATHNLEEIMRTTHNYNTNEVVSWAEEFDNWLEESLTTGRYEDVKDYQNNAPHATKAHPTPEHFYPLHVALGAAGENTKAELICRSWDRGTMSSASYKFTDSPK